MTGLRAANDHQIAQTHLVNRMNRITTLVCDLPCLNAPTRVHIQRRIRWQM